MLCFEFCSCVRCWCLGLYQHRETDNSPPYYFVQILRCANTTLCKSTHPQMSNVSEDALCVAAMDSVQLLWVFNAHYSLNTEVHMYNFTNTKMYTYTCTSKEKHRVAGHTVTASHSGGRLWSSDRSSDHLTCTCWAKPSAMHWIPRQVKCGSKHNIEMQQHTIRPVYCD